MTLQIPGELSDQHTLMCINLLYGEGSGTLLMIVYHSIGVIQTVNLQSILASKEVTNAEILFGIRMHLALMTTG